MTASIALSTTERMVSIPMSRWKAAAIHLGLSACIAGALLAVMLLIWYPWPLFEVAGGSGLMVILVGVDVVLGPLITLVIFKAGKKGLRFDLALIAVLQLAALAYGVNAVYVVRPAYIVFNVDRFNLVAAIDLDPADLARVRNPEFRNLPIDGPSFVAATLPSEPAERVKLIESALAGKDLQLFPQRYVPYAQEAKDALKHARNVAILRKRDPSGALDKFLAASERTPESVKFLPLRARTADAAVLIDAGSGAPLKILQIDPW